MLNAVLRLAANSSVLTVNELARDMSISPALAEQLFDELTRRGYLQAVASPQCSAPCGHCLATEACHFFRQVRMWSLTAKGQRACRRAAGDRDQENPSPDARR
jgi:predicted ArsR family transcriptional regulator